MKKLRLCLEIFGLAEDENGNKGPGGLCMTIGEIAEEKYDCVYKEMVESVNLEGVLRTACLDGMFTSADCKIISPEEYDEKYGD